MYFGIEKNSDTFAMFTSMTKINSGAPFIAPDFFLIGGTISFLQNNDGGSPLMQLSENSSSLSGSV